ncbi:hypothetical protein [Alkalibacterium iburiense]
MKLVLFDKDGHVKTGKNDYDEERHPLSVEGKKHIHISTQDLIYEKGDYFQLDLAEENKYLFVQLNQTLAPSLIYVKDNQWRYDIPLEDNWKESIPEKSFKGKRHYISIREAKPFEIEAYQNLSLNTHDLKDETGAYPHASANVETRNDSTFFAKNAIDGVYANTSHGSYPYQSWGINQQDDAELKIDFGRTVEIDEVEVTLRADFPHDNYWIKGTIQFSDGEETTLQFIKTKDPQSFSIEKKQTEWLILKNLIKSDESSSPFPALTQLAAFGRNLQR